jgi:ADP-ribose pyrophosphatase YjhB (NUDIX family)
MKINNIVKMSPMNLKKFNFNNFSLTTKKTTVLTGSSEVRYVSKIKLTPTLLKEFFNYQNEAYLSTSFNTMLITTDNKVLLMQRNQSFHFSKVMEGLHQNNVNSNLFDTLYKTEVDYISKIFFSFLPTDSTLKSTITNKIIHIFPGGHSFKKETIIETLLREFHEETNINLSVDNLKFEQTYIFNVIIYDSLIKKHFNNFIFPAKVNMSSQEVSKNFKETNHTKNPTFININGYNTLYEAFLHVQNFILL